MAFLPAPNENVLMISGEIVPGDYPKFEALVAKRIPSQLVLDSPGGDYIEALHIARDVNLMGLRTIAPLDQCQKGDGVYCRCASSCFFIWAAGRQRLGDVVMIHLPQTPPKLTGVDRKLAAEAIAKHVVWFMGKIDMPQSIVDAVLATPFERPRRLTAKEMHLLESHDVPGAEPQTAKYPSRESARLLTAPSAASIIA